MDTRGKRVSLLSFLVDHRSTTTMNDDEADDNRLAKKAKLATDTPQALADGSFGITSLIHCSKGRHEHLASPPTHHPSSTSPITTESVLHLPPRLTKSAYQILIATDSVPRSWHLEGRFGSRTHVVEKGVTNGIPVLHNQVTMDEIAQTSAELKELMDNEGVEVVEKEFVHNHRTRQNIPYIDARIHPELEPDGYEVPSVTHKPMETSKKANSPLFFSYAEMFAGIGGFGVALEALGGRCVFYSEIDERCRETYALNFDTPSSCIHGDIYEVPDSAFPKDLDLLVAGFPCQPFSTLGDQPGFDCHKGRGQLFLQIVRALELSRPRSFLLENVPGLLGMKDALDVILKAFRGAGYKVSAEVCSSRGLTATSRKRLFFVGVREDLVLTNTSNNSSCKEETESQTLSATETDTLTLDSAFFQFPYIPDLRLCSHDILDYESLPQSELEILRLSPSTFEQLSQNKRWKPNQLAWPNVHCDTLTSHYGNAVGRGDCQLVPSSAPHPPRRFSVRECARLMGFPDSYQFCDIRENQGEMAHRKEGYRMLGNAVCPPLIAALAGSVLDAAGVFTGKNSKEKNDRCNDNWTVRGRQVSVDLARAAMRTSPVQLPAGCIVWSSSNDSNISS
jgi:DNA (cytosine-5)-methyltransferase 1